mgnify:CR=1 FL=1
MKQSRQFALIHLRLFSLYTSFSKTKSNTSQTSETVYIFNVSKSEKEKWGVIIETYLSNRENLCEVILVVDIRHAPSKEDVLMYNWLLEYGFTGYVIATKADKISKGQWNKHIKIIKDTLNIKDGSLVLPFSSDSKVNLEMIHQKIEEILMEE